MHLTGALFTYGSYRYCCHTLAKQMFIGVYWNHPVCPSVHVSVRPYEADIVG